jgi:hypothetical protein
MTSRTLTVGILLGWALACPSRTPCFGQEAAKEESAKGEERRWQGFSRQVLVENCHLESSVINMVATAQAEQSKASADEGPRFIWSLNRNGSHISPQVEICTLAVEWEESTDRPEEAWNIARADAEAALRGVQDAATSNRQNDINRQIDKLQVQKEEYRRQLDQVREKLNAISGPYSEQFTRAQFDAGVGKLQELELERVGVAARRQAIEGRIDELREHDAESAHDDPVIVQLRKLVDIREEQFANVKALVDSGQQAASSSDMRSAEAEVVHARIEMLRAQRAAGESANGPLLRELNNELSRLIIRDAELKAMRDALDERRQKLESLIEAADERALLTRQSESLRGVIDVLEDKIRELDSDAHQPQGPITIKPLTDALPTLKR